MKHEMTVNKIKRQIVSISIDEHRTIYGLDNKGQLYLLEHREDKQGKLLLKRGRFVWTWRKVNATF